MNLYVGNLAYTVSEDQLKAAFAAFGDVKSARVIMDRMTGRPRGFAFVEMASHDAGLRAIEGLNGKDLSGRALRVNEANPRTPNGGGNERNDRYDRNDRY